ncbi:hypothetical protein GIB67_032647 [Kingdonia uniflora]|uniref:LIM zinc-binding domain-containing protein n=1 Tax=Kingdonia uniflora TaxID=39325 RepID=A0A7J7PA51_9MAGN|nr:hypothetical protein GIB67_032647 [Kingdonia uniflora]
MASSGINHITQHCIQGNYGERKSSFMKWVGKLFKGGSSNGITEGRHRPTLLGEETMARHAPRRSMVRNSHYKALSCIRYKRPTDNDEDLARELQENLNLSSCPPWAPTQYLSRGYRLCGGCKREIGSGNYLGCMGAFWHPGCFRCHACSNPITEHEIPTNGANLIEYRSHPFWSQKYCPSHEHDNTARCCSCERLEGFHHMPETRGLCLSEEQTVTSILRRPRIGGNRLIGMRTHPQKLTRKCEVTAILVLYGLPRLLTGSILAHELMHGWLRLKGYHNLSPEVEEGICQMLSYMWLESEVMPGSTSMPSSSTASSSSSSSSKKDGKSNTEKKLGEFFMHLIAHDTSAAYGEGFRAANTAVNKYGLRRTLDHIRLTGNFPV